jgi:HEPN domain-containing protein
MRPITAEWVAKSEEDWALGMLAFRSRKIPCYDGACFHAQQCAEEYLKALLDEARLDLPRTHDLKSLLDLLPGRDEAWEALRPSLVVLSRAAVTMRYPGDVADRPAAKEALATARRVRALARKRLGLGE